MVILKNLNYDLLMIIEEIGKLHLYIIFYIVKKWNLENFKLLKLKFYNLLNL